MTDREEARERDLFNAARGLDCLSEHVHAGNIERGFFEDRDPKNTHHLLAMHMLIVTELAELTEAVRARVPAESEHIPEFTSEEEELADAVIRCLDYAAFRRLRLGQAVVAKLAFNATRGHRHGGKRA